MNKKLFLLLFYFVVSIANVHAAYFAKLTLTKGDDQTGAGKVYVATSVDEKPKYDSTKVSAYANTQIQGGSVTFYLYAQNRYGYKFDKWESKTDGVTFGSPQREEKSLVMVNASSKPQSNNASFFEVYPVYKPYPSTFDLTFVLNEGVESYTIDGPEGYPLDFCTEDATIPTHDNDSLTIVANPKNGYAVSEWYIIDSAGKNKLAGASNVLTKKFSERARVGVDVQPCIFKVDQTLFTDIESAIEYAKASTSKTIILTSDYTLHGEHTIPEGVTLLIPYDAAYTLCTDEPEMSYPNEGGKPLGAYRTLTLASDAKLNVNGSISVGAKINARSGDITKAYAAGSPDGYYGHIVVESGSEINLKSGSTLYVPGFITGDGTVTAESGSTVYETMQIMDWRGGSASTGMPQEMFPFNQYYIQNIESKLEIGQGAKEILYVCVGTPTTDEKINFATTSFLDNSASFFIKGADAVVTKKYDKENDKLIFDVYSGKIIVNGLSMTIDGKPISSESYNLPITNNMQFNLHAGSEVIFDEDQNAMLAAGAIINVDKNAKLTVNSNLYVYDSEEWGNYASKANIRPLEYIPSTAGNKSVRTIGMKLDDAQINVEGKIEVNGSLYTSKSGSNISGSEGGEVKYISAAASDETFMTMAKNGSGDTENVDFTSAQLHNEDASYTPTKDAPANSIFKYVDGQWVLQGVNLEVHTPVAEVKTMSLGEWVNEQKTNPNALAKVSNSGVRDYLDNNFTNIIVGDGTTYSCNNFVLTDKAPIQVPVDFTAVNASYKRTGSSTWGTICMPFALDSDDDVQYYQFKSFDMETGYMMFEEVKHVDANTPAVYSIAEGDSELMLGGENLNLKVAKYNNEYVAPNKNATDLTLYGVLNQQSKVLPMGDNSYYFIAKNKFWQPSTNDVTIAPMRAYFKTNSSTPVSARMFAIAKVERSENEDMIDEEIEEAVNAGEDNEESDVIADEPDNVIIVDEPKEPEMKNETVEEVIAQPTSILMLPQGVSIVQYYNSLGQKQSKLTKGLNIIKLSNGETRKIIIK